MYAILQKLKNIEDKLTSFSFVLSGGKCKMSGLRKLN